MENKILKEAISEAYKNKYRGRKYVRTKYRPLYPDSPEREYIRATNAYMRIMNQTIKDFLPEIMEAYKSEMNNDSRMDGLFSTIGAIFAKVGLEFEQRISMLDFAERIKKIAKMTRNAARREWKKIIEATLGVEAPERYYSEEFYESMLKLWADDNVNMIKTLPGQSLDRMRDIIFQGFREGATAEQIGEQLQKEYNMTKKHAQFIARDQVATLNFQITKFQQEDAGVKKYQWECMNDKRVRDSHREFNGKVFYWNDPPEVWHKNAAGEIIYEGRRCHPGQDYMCRCIAIPIFEEE